MPKLSTAGWIAHDLGLAAAIGGALFGRVAFDPSLKRIRNAKWRDKVNEEAWGRYGPVTLGAHALVAVPWVIGRMMLSGREVSDTARSLTRAKDILVGVSVVCCLASALLARLMASGAHEPGPEEARAHGGQQAHDGADRRKVILDHAVDAAGMINLAANVGLMGVTTALAMEGAESKAFVDDSRALP